MTWQIVNNHHSHGALRISEVDGVPVLVKKVGLYPNAQSENGQTLRDTPHVRISILGSCQSYSGVTVEAVGLPSQGRERSLRVFCDTHYDGSQKEAFPDKWIALGDSKIPQAIQRLAALDSEYENAQKVILGVTENYRVPLSREEYEAACEACGVDALDEQGCQSYGVTYGTFSFPEHEALYVVKMHLAYLRQLHIKQQAKATTPETAVDQQPIKMAGQLWEPCERCGCEPVYLPLHLCDKCWPRSE